MAIPTAESVRLDCGEEPAKLTKSPHLKVCTFHYVRLNERWINLHSLSFPEMDGNWEKTHKQTATAKYNRRWYGQQLDKWQSNGIQWSKWLWRVFVEGQSISHFTGKWMLNMIDTFSHSFTLILKASSHFYHFLQRCLLIYFRFRIFPSIHITKWGLVLRIFYLE